MLLKFKTWEIIMRVLAIGAHPDDIEIACSGTLAKCVKRGDTVIVCHVSSGNLGHVVIPPDELRVIRANEAKKAGAMAGIEVICAGFDDLEIYDNNKEARDKLVDIIKYANPDFIITQTQTIICLTIRRFPVWCLMQASRQLCLTMQASIKKRQN